MPALTIYPYLYPRQRLLGFRRRANRLKEEAFVLGMSEMISRVVEAKSIPNPGAGFALTFSDQPLDHDVELSWLSPEEASDAAGRDKTGECGRDWQLVPGRRLWRDDGRLASARRCFLYFQTAPKKIYAKASPLPAGINPIWDISADDPMTQRFVAPPVELT